MLPQTVDKETWSDKVEIIMGKLNVAIINLFTLQILTSNTYILPKMPAISSWNDTLYSNAATTKCIKNIFMT